MYVVYGLLVAGCSPATQEKIEQAGESVASAAASVEQEAGQAASTATETMEEAAGKAAGAATEAVQEAASDAMAGAQATLANVASKAAEALNDVQGGPELLNKITEFFGSAGKAVQGVTDVESAKAALPTLQELTAKADELSQSVSSLPEGAKSAIASVMESGLGELKTLVEKVLALPGVEEVLKPAIGDLMEKLQAWSGAKQ
jgi:hypothetical protein